MTKETGGRSALRDVAAAAGVSITTASLILNGKTESFSVSTVERVQGVARDLEYRPNVLARSLRTQRTHTIGLISDKIATTPFAGAMIRGAQEAAWKSGHILVLMDTEGERDLEEKALEAILDRRVEGLLYARMNHQVVSIPKSITLLPAVLLDARDPEATLPSVVPDELGGAGSAVRHLIEQGHSRIGYVQNPDPVPASEERLAAYRSTLEQAGLDYDPSLVVYDRLEPGGWSPEVKDLLIGSDRPTALFCFNDLTALRAYQSARRVGLDIPDDISIVGFDNLETIAPWLDPGLTTVQLPHYEMGRWAVERLERMIDGEDLPAEQHRMECPLVVRESVGIPRVIGSDIQ